MNTEVIERYRLTNLTPGMYGRRYVLQPPGTKIKRVIEVIWSLEEVKRAKTTKEELALSVGADYGEGWAQEAAQHFQGDLRLVLDNRDLLTGPPIIQVWRVGVSSDQPIGHLPAGRRLYLRE